MAKKRKGGPHPNNTSKHMWHDALGKDFTLDNQYMKRLIELSTVMFEWKNLPDEIDPRYIELTLFLQGRCLFFKDDALGDKGTYLTLGYNDFGGKYDVYGNPTERLAFSVYNSYQFKGDKTNSVPIYNNNMRLPSYPDLIGLANRLSQLDQIIDVNCNAQKTPMLILCDKEQRLSLMNLYEQYEGNMPVIFGDSALNRDAVGSIDTGAQYIGRELYDLKCQYWNEALSYLGITNGGHNKKERLNDMEFASLQGGTIANRYARLTQRREACDEINKLFDLNVQCDFRQDFEIPLDLIEEMQNTADDAPEIDNAGRTDDERNGEE